MHQITRASTRICPRCTRVLREPTTPVRRFSRSTSVGDKDTNSSTQDGENKDVGGTQQTHEADGSGAMTRRLEDLSQQNLEDGGRSARKALEEAGFDDALKDRLLERLEGAKFKEEHVSAFARVGTPASAGKGTQDIASGRAWTGEESIEDATLRMLDDAHKKIRVPSRPPNIQRPPRRIDTGRPKNSPSAGARLANARDRTSMYSYLKDENYTEKEKEQMRRELKERFSPGARPMPTTLQGLTSLANERIEDAIARGQFKNLPRGQKLERDYNMSSPFLDTTEYFLNKMIKKQEIVPPWIEKQQELVSSANKFRSRLRVEWRRHAARLIASKGGNLEDQVRTARQYAEAEAIVNPSKTKVEQVNAIDKEGHMSQITLSGDLTLNSDGSQGVVNVDITEKPVDPETAAPLANESDPPSAAPLAGEDANGRIVNGAVFVFRDPQWEETERAYHTTAINNLNSLTRSYNLMAPDLAKKPYYRLDRELRSCFADVAPQLADAIRERALKPKLNVSVSGRKSGGVLENFTTSKARVYDEQKPQYGFKEFWRDVFGSKQAN